MYLSGALRADRCTKGFTLIELLIVISIITILTAILFPAFSRARENARRASCASNLKQIGLGILQYSQDHDEFFPFQPGSSAGDYSTPIGFQRYYMGWNGKVYPYIKSWKIFRCPSVKDFPAAAGQPIGNSDNSYAGNGVIIRSRFSDFSPRRVVHHADIENPANIILVHEFYYAMHMSMLRPYDGNEAVGYIAGRFYEWLPEEEPVYGGTMDRVHFDGANILFADGHLKFRKLSGIAASEFGLTDVTGGPSVGSAPEMANAAPLF